jgi:hypothetical protein
MYYPASSEIEIGFHFRTLKKKPEKVVYEQQVQPSLSPSSQSFGNSNGAGSGSNT